MAKLKPTNLLHYPTSTQILAHIIHLSEPRPPKFQKMAKLKPTNLLHYPTLYPNPTHISIHLSEPRPPQIPENGQTYKPHQPTPTTLPLPNSTHIQPTSRNRDLPKFQKMAKLKPTNLLHYPTSTQIHPHSNHLSEPRPPKIPENGQTINHTNTQHLPSLYPTPPTFKPPLGTETSQNSRKWPN